MIGLLIAGFLILIFYGIPCCVYIYLKNHRRRQCCSPTVRTVTSSSSSHTVDAIPVGQARSSSPHTINVTTSRPSTPALRTTETAQQNYNHTHNYQPQTQPETAPVRNTPPVHREFIQEAPPPYDTAINYPRAEFTSPTPMDNSEVVASAPPLEVPLPSYLSEAPPPYPGTSA